MFVSRRVVGRAGLGPEAEGIFMREKQHSLTRRKPAEQGVLCVFSDYCAAAGVTPPC